MLEYGNIVPPPSGIKQLVSTSNAIYIVMSDGRCYVRGVNTNYKLGLAQNSVAVDNRWLLMGTDVHTCYGASANTILVKIDGTVLAYGVNFTTSAGGTYPISGSNITSSFGSLDMRTCVDFIPSGNTAMILMPNGNLYGIGANSSYMYGNDTVPFQTQPYLMDTGVTAIERSRNISSANFYIKNGTLIVNGDNSTNYITGINTSTVMRTYNPVTLPAGYVPEKIRCSGYSTHIIARETATNQLVLLYTGSNGPSSSGFYDRGAATDLLQRTFTPVGLEYMNGRIGSSFLTTHRSPGTNIVFTPSKVYTCGLSNCIGRPNGGSAVNVWTFAEASVPSSYAGSVLGYCYLSEFLVTIFATKDKLYMSGTTQYLFKDVPILNSYNAFVEIDLPG